MKDLIFAAIVSFVFIYVLQLAIVAHSVVPIIALAVLFVLTTESIASNELIRGA